MDVGRIIMQLSQGNNPPLYEILLHYWIQLFGIEAFSVRFLPLIFNVLTVFVVYRLGLKFFNLNVGLIAACLVIFSNYHIYYTHETRVYPLFMLLTTISMYCFLSLQKCPKSRRYLSLLIISNLLLIYAHFFGFFVLIIEALAVLFVSPFRNILLKKYVFSLVIVLIGYLPYIPVFISRFFYSSTQGTWVKPPNSFVDLYNMLWRFSNMPLTTVIYLIVLGLGLSKYSKHRKSVSISPQHSLIILWFLFPFLFMYFISYKIPIFSERYLAFITVGYYLCVSVAADAIFTVTKFKVLMSTTIILLMLTTSNPNFDFQNDTENAILYVKNIKDRESAKSVFFAPKWFDINFAYYYNRAWFTDYDDIEIKRKMHNYMERENIFPILTVADIEISKVTDGPIYIHADNGTGNDSKLIIDYLSQYFHLKKETSFGTGFRVYEFDKKK